jgi:hypothetical protein
MRLPGTINIPNEKKRKKGRTEALAMVVSEDMTRVYPLSAFTKAKPKSGAGGASATADVTISPGPLPRIDLDELPAGVT